MSILCCDLFLMETIHNWRIVHLYEPVVLPLGVWKSPTLESGIGTGNQTVIGRGTYIKTETRFILINFNLDLVLI